MPGTESDRMGLVAITNLFPHPLEPQRSTFNERQLVALGARFRLHVVSPISWLSRLRYRLQGRNGAIAACRQWQGVATTYPTYWYVPRVLAWLRGHLMAASILAPTMRIARANAARALLATWAFPDGFAATIAGRRLGLPVFIKVHGSDVEKLAIRGWERTLALRGLRRARGVISVSTYLRDRLVEQGIDAGRIRVVYNGVDAATFHLQDRARLREALGLPAGQRILLYVGGLKHDKGVRDLLAPEPLEAARRLGALILVIGTGPLRTDLERLVATGGLGGEIQLLGGKAPAEVARYMGAADGLCLPSHHEGIPNVILEALACGLPVLATNVGGIPEIVNDANGILVPPLRPRELAAGIERFFERTWARSAVQATCPAGSWAQSAAALEAAIREGLD